SPRRGAPHARCSPTAPGRRPLLPCLAAPGCAPWSSPCAWRPGRAWLVGDTGENRRAAPDPRARSGDPEARWTLNPKLLILVAVRDQGLRTSRRGDRLGAASRRRAVPRHSRVLIAAQNIGISSGGLRGPRDTQKYTVPDASADHQACPKGLIDCDESPVHI